LRRLPLLAMFLAVAAAKTALAGDVLERVRRDNVVRCAAEERPGVAVPRPDGGVEGIAVDLCRHVAVAVLGRGGRIAFTPDGPVEDSDVALVATGGVAARVRLAFGPVVFVERLSILVPATSPVRVPRDLAGETVCLMIASPAHSALEKLVRQTGIDITRLAFEEDVEMNDAYAVGRCGAMVGGEATLSGLREPMGINRLVSRLVAASLARVSLMAATGTSDRGWSAIVFWVARSLTGQSRSTVQPPGIRRGSREEMAVPAIDRAATAAFGADRAE
jgi:general L-amino acid transport system substrate-binding protein